MATDSSPPDALKSNDLVVAVVDESFFKIRDAGKLSEMAQAGYEGVIDPTGGLHRTSEMPLRNHLRSTDLVTPRAEVFDLTLTPVVGSHLRISCSIRVGGDQLLWGAGSHSHCTDSLGVIVRDKQGVTLGEMRLHFYFRVARPGETLELSGFFSWADVLGKKVRVNAPSESVVVSVDLVRENSFWFGARTLSNGPITSEFDSRTLTGLGQIPLDIYTLPISMKKVALTFDGGSNNRLTEKLLDVLRDQDVRCTIFVTGYFVERYPELLKEMKRDGHEIGNHTMSHPDLCVDYDPNTSPGITESKFKDELLRVEKCIHTVLEDQPAKVWRAPYGHRNSQIVAWARECGYQHIGWSIDSNDYKIGSRSGLTAQKAFDEVCKSIYALEDSEIQPIAPIILCHLSSSDQLDPTYPPIQSLIRNLKLRGWEFTTVSATLHPL
jgi:peptidoglycan/xylan/chitin deacetylase (PgdA/CDA1 family)